MKPPLSELTNYSLIANQKNRTQLHDFNDLCSPNFNHLKYEQNHNAMHKGKSKIGQSFMLFKGFQSNWNRKLGDQTPIESPIRDKLEIELEKKKKNRWCALFGLQANIISSFRSSKHWLWSWTTPSYADAPIWSPGLGEHQPSNHQSLQLQSWTEPSYL